MFDFLRYFAVRMFFLSQNCHAFVVRSLKTAFLVANHNGEVCSRIIQLHFFYDNLSLPNDVCLNH